MGLGIGGCLGLHGWVGRLVSENWLTKEGAVALVVKDRLAMAIQYKQYFFSCRCPKNPHMESISSSTSLDLTFEEVIVELERDQNG